MGMRSASLLAVFVYSVSLIGVDTCQAQWTPTTGPSVLRINSFVKVGNRILAGENLSSSDDGLSWSTSKGDNNEDFTQMALNDSTVFGVTTTDGVFRSTDYGRSWSPADSGLPGFPTVYDVRQILVNDHRIFVTTVSEGLYSSMDNGKSWHPVITGQSSPNIYSGPLFLFGGTLYWVTDRGLFLSRDGGNQWLVRDTGAIFKQISCVCAVGSIIIAGIAGAPDASILLRSDDSGRSWKQIPTGLSKNNRFSSMTTYGTAVYAGTFTGFYESTDLGAHWTDLTPPILSGDGRTVYGVFTTPDVMLISCGESGVYRSTDGGSTWSARGPGSTIVNDLAAMGSNIYATSRSWNFAPDAFFVSNNNGDNWGPPNGDGGPGSLASIGSNLFLGLVYQGLRGIAGNSLGMIFYWQGENDVWATGNDLFFFSSHYGQLISLDSGLTWDSLPSPDLYSFVGVGPVLVGAGDSGVFHSTDKGQHWKRAQGVPQDSATFDQFVISGTTLFCGTANAIYRSLDSGFTWTIASSGLPSGVVQSHNGGRIPLLAANPNFVFVETTQGVWMSDNGGTSWHDWNDGLGTDTVTCFALNDEYLFAGTNGGGVWRRPLANLGSSVPTTLPQFDLVLSPNYPNPCSTHTTISFSCGKQCFVDLKIVDLLGRECITLLSSEVDAGEHSVNWDASNLPNGVYRCLIRSEEGLVAQSSIVVRH